MVAPLQILISPHFRPNHEFPGIHLIWLLDCINQWLQDEIRLHFQSGKAIAKDWLTTAKRWIDGLGCIAGSITLGVIMLNFINTALTYRNLTREGDFSAKDIGKVTYGLGYKASEDLIWETWVPLDKDAAYLELQIWYPASLLKTEGDDKSYLFQLELGTTGDTAVDGLASVELEVKASNRIGALTLEVAEGTPV
ncbi:hypothetical protein G0D98_20475 [Pseudomonas savastanoi pv. phaseolicola]|uniref:Uncharacterized protein n=1 Tax=Pseudomonas savastanoi pv. glycinea TaxID=318 RepID=A0A0P9SX76_PSESG|nr:Uncharacterized protein ALO37_02815 [Pseudomonas savastanoi pv. glycinea]MBN3470832.1 hypothetical protein [Pseudomonas savastanoi pv. phaseolicola]MBN3477858.1 hypothetical protein [Pseudomonas savastanoi pv. phaseolicola]MBN4176554.1 hypothetical protein [Pseudomonas savastanoi pv. phaseolicola]PYD10599.1 hypothetical protein DND36_30405 [Pseudomonas savastanoi pv. glycinea]